MCLTSRKDPQMLIPALSMDHFIHCDIILRLITHEFSCSQFATSLCCNLRPSQCLFWQMLRWRFRTFQRGSLLSRMCHHGWGTTQGLGFVSCMKPGGCANSKKTPPNGNHWYMVRNCPCQTINSHCQTIKMSCFQMPAEISAFFLKMNHYILDVFWHLPKPACWLADFIALPWYFHVEMEICGISESKWLTFGWAAAVSLLHAERLSLRIPQNLTWSLLELHIFMGSYGIYVCWFCHGFCSWFDPSFSRIRKVSPQHSLELNIRILQFSLLQLWRRKATWTHIYIYLYLYLFIYRYTATAYICI